MRCARWPTTKKAARRRLSRSAKADYLLAAIAAAAAADAAASTVLAAEAASDIDDAAGAIGAGVAIGVVAGTTTSSFLPQAVNAAAAIRVANSSDLFMCILIKKCLSTIIGKGI